MAEKDLELENYDDEVSGEATSQDNDLIKKYGRTTLIAIVALVVLAGGIIFYKYQEEQNIFEASAHIAFLTEILVSGDYVGALESNPSMQINGKQVLGLKQIAEKYSGSETGKLAAMYAGVAYLSQSDYASAKNYFQKAKGSDSEITQLGALSGLAACMENDGDHKGAASLYEELIKLNESELNEQKFKYLAALNYEKANETEKAIKYYTEVAKLYTFTEFGNLSKIGLTRLGTIFE